MEDRLKQIEDAIRAAKEANDNKSASDIMVLSAARDKLIRQLEEEQPQMPAELSPLEMQRKSERNNRFLLSDKVSGLEGLDVAADLAIRGKDFVQDVAPVIGQGLEFAVENPREAFDNTINVLGKAGGAVNDAILNPIDTAQTFINYLSDTGSDVIDYTGQAITSGITGDNRGLVQGLSDAAVPAIELASVIGGGGNLARGGINKAKRLLNDNKIRIDRSKFTGPINSKNNPELPPLPIQGPSLPIQGPPMPIKPTVKTMDKINNQLDKIYKPNYKQSAITNLIDALENDGLSSVNLKDTVNSFKFRNKRTPTLLEIGDENIVALASTAAGTMGKGRNIIERYRENILGQQTQIVDDIANRAMGREDKSFFVDLDNLQKTMQTKAEPFYTAAYLENILPTEILQDAINTPMGKKALRGALRTIQQMQRPDLLNQVKLVDKRTVLGGQDGKVNIQFLDIIKKEWDDIIEARRSDITGVLDLGQGYFKMGNATLRESFLPEIDNLSNNYRKARQTYSEPAGMKDALIKGRMAGKRPNITAEDMQIAKDHMTVAENDLYNGGFIRGLTDFMEGGTDEANNINKIINKKRLRDKLKVLFEGDVRAADVFIMQLKEYANTVKKTQQISSKVNSKTARNISDTGTVNVTGGLSNMVMGIFKDTYSAVRGNRTMRETQEMNKEIAEIMTQELTEENLSKLINRLSEKK